ncbi:MAG TPA: methionyl-tRNA formyltransferase [Candidatus Paceibacterota bacterium]|nr:methionyl-tRNA formyltransferase [Candidatus Paceibacterota bacterium]
MSKPFLFFGTPYVARDTLAALVAAGYVPKAVVTAPDAPRGRGQIVTPCETKTWALEHDLPVLTPTTLDAAAIEELRALGAEYAIVVAYGKIMPQTLIDSFPLGVLNVHYSLLPKYRGASPVEAALLHNESVTGVSIQQMVFKLDAGDVLATKEVAIDPLETTRELRPRLIEAGAQLLIDTLPAFEAGTVTRTPQDENQATHTKKIRKEDGLLSLSGDAQENWNKYRAYAESPGTYFFMQRGDTQIRVKIKTANYKDGRFIPLRVVPEGKKETDYRSLAN